MKSPSDSDTSLDLYGSEPISSLAEVLNSWIGRRVKEGGEGDGHRRSRLFVQKSVPRGRVYGTVGIPRNSYLEFLSFHNPAEGRHS
eukprot:1103326-Prorocentrum_minimum.AAC.1